ncbi:MAG: metal ABC transporter substrate-binding protein [Candidatus Asgardarchaeia archaeon]
MKRGYLLVTLIILTLISFNVRLVYATNTDNSYHMKFSEYTQPYIVASIPSLAAIVKEVVGNTSKVDAVLPEGVDPHSYSLTVNDIKKIRAADILILADKSHLTLEQQILENAPGKIFFDFENYTQYGAFMISIPGFEKNFHGYWLYPTNALAIAKTITQKLGEIYPEYKDVFEGNLYVFETKVNKFLSKLSDFIREHSLNGTGVAIAVPGIAYLAKIFGFSIKALFVKGPNRFINASEIAEIEKMVANGSIKYLLCEEILKEGKPGQITQQIAEDTGASVIYITAFAMGDVQDYLALLAYNVGAIKTALETPKIQEISFNITLLYVTIGILSLITILEGFVIFRIRRSVEE